MTLHTWKEAAFTFGGVTFPVADVTADLRSIAWTPPDVPARATTSGSFDMTIDMVADAGILRAFLSPPQVAATVSTLARRCFYGGRKAHSARRRLHRDGLMPMSIDAGPDGRSYIGVSNLSIRVTTTCTCPRDEVGRRVPAPWCAAHPAAKGGRP